MHVLRSKEFNGDQKALLFYIATFSTPLEVLNIKKMADDFQWSERKLRYVINGLCRKKILEKKHGLFKRLTLSILIDKSLILSRGPEGEISGRFNSETLKFP